MDTHQEVNRIDDESLNSTLVEKTDDNVVQMPTQLTSTTGMYFDHLNEDCLLEIFSTNVLSLIDLCSLAETCTRFKQITQRVFPKEFCIENGYGGTYKFISKNSKSLKTEGEVLRILANFGHYLFAYSSRGNEVVMNAVAKYCSDGALKQLTFSEMDCTKDVLIKYKSIFQRLQVLSIRRCSVYSDITDLQLNFDSLIELNIIHVESCDAILEKTLPKLERFTFDDAAFNFGRGDLLSKFIGRHKFLRSLHMDRCYVLNRNDLIHTIGNSLNELAELTLRNSHRQKVPVDFSKLQNLKQLRMLHVSIDPVEFDAIFTLLPALKLLETVKVSREFSSSTIFSCLQVHFRPIRTELQNLRELYLIGCNKCRQLPWIMFSRLKKLYVFDSTCSAELPYIIDQLKNLEELEIGDVKSKLSEKDFEEILKIFEGRPNVLKLKCRMFKSCKYLKNFDESRNVKLINL